MDEIMLITLNIIIKVIIWPTRATKEELEAFLEFK